MAELNALCEDMSYELALWCDDLLAEEGEQLGGMVLFGKQGGDHLHGGGQFCHDVLVKAKLCYEVIFAISGGGWCFLQVDVGEGGGCDVDFAVIAQVDGWLANAGFSCDVVHGHACVAFGGQEAQGCLEDGFIDLWVAGAPALLAYAVFMYP